MDTKRQTAFNNAIEAANAALAKAGITDVLVAELGLINASTDAESLTNSDPIERVKCSCWDCVNTNGGRCVCGGPACAQQ